MEPIKGVVKAEQLVVTDKLKNIITPLGKEEFQQLHDNIVEEGCREPLIVWEKKGKYILVDGHNRYQICTRHNIPFQVVTRKFKDQDEVISWMINNQLGRRNLNKDQISYYRGLKYENMKRGRGGYGNVLSKGQNEPLTATILARHFKTSESTIKRDAKFARGLDRIGNSNQKLKMDILSGFVKVKKSDVILFADVENRLTRSIRNEADLCNRAKILRNELLSDLENKLQEEKEQKIREAQQKLQQMEPVFSNWQDRVQKVKGRILSSINRAIEDRDAKALDQLKQHIYRLELLLQED